jgi:HTH-type transcriptional regulator/antitoxin HipB
VEQAFEHEEAVVGKLQRINCIYILQLSGCILILQLLGCNVLNTAYNLYKNRDTRAKIMNTVYPLKTLNQLRPLLVGFRKEKGLTQKDVSEKLGVTQQTYARLEANPATASLDRLFRVFNVLGIEMVFSSQSDPEKSSMEEIKPDYLSTPARKEQW